MKKLPPVVYIDNSDGHLPGYPPVVAVYRERLGFHPVDQLVEAVNRLNEGINEDAILVMVHGAIFGWDAPRVQQFLSTQAVDKRLNNLVKRRK